MIHAEDFLSVLQTEQVQFFAGVPDSLLKELCACFSDKLRPQQHVIAANEGGAIGLAIGHYLATQQVALVYMQNSGLGNVVNPIASLADPQVYGIPMLLLVGWRGEIADNGEQIHDEPQHVKQGQMTLSQLDALGLPHQVMADDIASAHQQIKSLLTQALERQGPVALVVRKQRFAPYQSAQSSTSTPSTLAEKLPVLHSREHMIQQVVAALPENAAVVATTGMASRELFELRKAQQAGHGRDFLTVGGMGHASQIACGIALAQPDRQVVCIDGDGAMLMHMGSLTISAQRPNLVHIVLNNGAHDSVGGQPTIAAQLSLAEIASAAGYAQVLSLSDPEQLQAVLKQSFHGGKSRFIEVLCRKGARADLGRPTRTPAQNKQDFMQFLSEVTYA
ncbi:phosphonopyruvate decarboxylase [Methylophilus medardicus]|uniref:Phosphonopyruvate decarboxylase n=1 Tax=Methylophilus medardicus TaxID=2588534 RepID=A0A5B8CTG7_9PROT|nr:phosphonopyruvate decarboxylase [Methylophilus medardicus]QDC44346.1 phosphonopyruvate decarboxylase [Methylophilus medardicus]QDC49353.1 phosphonopyruvate decarboxylase [Methylophilus medardicus]QDC53058.1 phosphonopyruvate decarboxylase [Methylophilus medardicus]